MRSRFAAAAVVALGLLAGPAASEEPNGPDGPPVPSVTVLGSRQADGILGKQVRSRIGENLGHVVDVIVDRAGRARAVVIDFGGFLGIGNRKIAVDWDVLDFAAGPDRRDVVTLDLTREQVRTAPEYKDRRTVIVLGSAGLLPPDR